MSAGSGQSSMAVHDVKDAGKVVVDAAGAVAVDRLRSEVDARSNRVAVELKAFAVAMHESTRSLREQGHHGQADIVSEIAGRADRLAAHLATSTTDDLVKESKDLVKQMTDYAKKEPALVIAAAFTLGLLIPKLLEAISDGS